MDIGRCACRDRLSPFAIGLIILVLGVLLFLFCLAYHLSCGASHVPEPKKPVIVPSQHVYSLVSVAGVAAVPCSVSLPNSTSAHTVSVWTTFALLLSRCGGT